jgi:hypothetical protein
MPIHFCANVGQFELTVGSDYRSFIVFKFDFSVPVEGSYEHGNEPFGSLKC